MKLFGKHRNTTPAHPLDEPEPQPAVNGQCTKTTKAGKRCALPARPGTDRCVLPAHQRI